MTGTDRPPGVYILVGMTGVDIEAYFGFEGANDNLSFTSLKGAAIYTSIHVFHQYLKAKLAPIFLDISILL